MPTVTLVIVTYNSSAVLPACAATLAQLEMPGGYELIIVDNASRDDSVAVAHQQFPTAQIITNRQNRGFAAAVNQGVALGSGRIVATLNPDTEVAPTWLAALGAPLDRDPQIGIVGSAISDPHDGHLLHSGGQYDAVTFRTMHRADVSQTSEADVDYVTGAGMAMRRTDWERLGGFDEGFFPAYFEDLDLCLRVRASGLRCLFVPQAQLHHHESTATGKQSGAFYFYYHRNRWRMISKALATGQLAPDFVQCEAQALCATNILDRMVALLVVRMGLPSAQRGLPDAAMQAAILQIGKRLSLLVDDAYQDPAHWPSDVQVLLGVHPVTAYQFSFDRQKINPAERNHALQPYPPLNAQPLLTSQTPLFQRLFSDSWLANLRTRLLGPQFVAFIDAVLQRQDALWQHQLALQTNLILQGLMVDVLQVELIIRQALLQHAIYYPSEITNEN
ncbi:MAG: glycosyltransferase family 2 protein [Chloroflexia bacterium]|nr:glycosyltransferase family 2 protein [Chloroflexia bacterium]